MSIQKNKKIKCLFGDTDEIIKAIDTFHAIQDKSTKISDLENHMTCLRHAVLDNGINSVNWLITYMCIGKIALTTIGEDFDVIQFAKMLLDKHQKYGLTPLINWSHLTVIIRIDSKLQRYLNLQNQPDRSDDEDQIQDILGYCVLGFYFCRYKSF